MQIHYNYSISYNIQVITEIGKIGTKLYFKYKIKNKIFLKCAWQNGLSNIFKIQITKLHFK